MNLSKGWRQRDYRTHEIEQYIEKPKPQKHFYKKNTFTKKNNTKLLSKNNAYLDGFKPCIALKRLLSCFG